MSFPLFRTFKMSALCTAALIALSACGGSDDLELVSVEFTHTPAPKASEPDLMAKTYTSSKAIYTYSNGLKEEHPLSYNTLYSVGDKISENKGVKVPAGQLFDAQMNPLQDPLGQPLVAETPDSNSLLKVGSKLYLVTHYEYDWLLSDKSEAWTKPGWYSRAPMSMTLTELKQESNGKLSVVKQRPIDFSSVDGLWIPCAGGPTPWNTHLGSEEDYDMIYNPLDKNYSTTTAGVKSMTELYFKNAKQANPYAYGWIPEVAVKEDGSTSVVKHYAMGRGTWELARVMPDARTAYMGDDGTHGQMVMFVADKKADLSAGTLYGAKFTQTSADGGGKGNLEWIRLGHASDAEIKALVDKGTKFTDIWDAKPFDSTAKSCPAGYKHIRAGSTTDECIALKPGMEKAAAFIETRRYIAYLGGTTEFNKYEGITVNAKDNKLYLAITAIDRGMISSAGEPADHMRFNKLSAGATFTADMKSGVKDTSGNLIDSPHVAVNLYVEPALLGQDIAKDDKGNTAADDRIANPDNLFFSEKMRTLFIGEDSSAPHTNNYLWAYNVDTKKLSRILSLPAGAESTGLQVVENVDGKGAYIMSNSQHWGDLSANVPEPLKSELKKRIDVFRADVGYIGGLPALK